MDRRWLGVGVAVAVAILGGSPRPGAQAPPPGPDRITWTAEWKYESQSPRDYERGRIGPHRRWRVRFNGVQKAGAHSTGAQRGWVSRQYEWDYQEYFEDTGFARDPVNNWRFLARFTRTCTNSGTVNLGPTEGEHNEALPTVQPTCVHTQTPIAEGYAKTDMLPGGTQHILNHLLPWPRTGCADGEVRRDQEPDGTMTTASWSTTVSHGVLDAVVEVDRGEYEAFVPEPGKTLTFTAQSPRPARFRFVLDEQGTSRFPGYATNANVDDVFFVKHDLGHLRGHYANDGPDVIFDPERFSATAWSRREPATVETRAADNDVAAAVTAMDYGAVGRMHAYADSPDCAGSWQPVKILVNGQAHDALDLPLDADSNLIADALEQYRGLESGADVDAEPKGNGMAGDGLTAFEEYRGFLTRGAACSWPESAVTLEPGMPQPEPFPGEQLPSGIPGWDDEHIRSAPRHKDLFVHTPDPELVGMLGGFGWASGLSVHAICEPHYMDNDSRIVNFTLQQAGLRAWRGRTVSQEQAQHGLALLPVEETQYASYGTAIPVVTGASGPPKYTWYVEIRKPLPIPGHSSRIARAVEDRRREIRGLRHLPLEWIVVHELGHAVGLTHHAEDVREWRDVPGPLNVRADTSPRQRAGGPIDYSRDYPADDHPDMLLVEPGPECDQSGDTAAYSKGQFVGCLAMEIARRGQQNSGEMDCPMRYPYGDWYEPPGSTARYLYSGFVTGRPEPGDDDLPVKVDAWSGRLRRYRDELDRIPVGRMCVSIRGTGINELSGDMNHAGDAGRSKACADFIVVNDVAAPDPRP